MKLLETICLDNGKKYNGVIDFVNTKHVYFFDLTNNSDVDSIMMIILWKGYNPDMRFSVWSMLNYPEFKLPEVILLPQKNIVGEPYPPTVIHRGTKVKHIFRVDSIIS